MYLENDAPAPLASTLLRWLLIALGLYVHYVPGGDGLLGILCGVGLMAQVLVMKRRPMDSLSPVGRFVVRWKKILLPLGALAVVGGALDTAGAW